MTSKYSLIRILSKKYRNDFYDQNKRYNHQDLAVDEFTTLNYEPGSFLSCWSTHSRLFIVFLSTKYTNPIINLGNKTSKENSHEIHQDIDGMTDIEITLNYGRKLLDKNIIKDQILLNKIVERLNIL